MRIRGGTRILLVLLVAVAALVAAPTAASAETGRYYVVGTPVNGQREYLFGIAAQTLGSGNRAPEIFELNKGRVQPDGATLTDPLELHTGWILVLPADAKGPGVHTGPIPVYSVAPPRPSAVPSAPATSPAGRHTAVSDGTLVAAGSAVVGVLLVALALWFVGSGPRRRRRSMAVPARRSDEWWDRPLVPAAPPRPADGTGPRPPDRAGKSSVDGRGGPPRSASADEPPKPPSSKPPSPPKPPSPRPSPPRTLEPASGVNAAASVEQPSIKDESRSEVLAGDPGDPDARPAGPGERSSFPVLRAEVGSGGYTIGLSLIGVRTADSGPAYRWLEPGDHPPDGGAVPVVLGDPDARRLYLDLARTPDVITLAGAPPDREWFATLLTGQLSARGRDVAVLDEARSGTGQVVMVTGRTGDAAFTGAVFCAEEGGADLREVRDLIANSGGRAVPILLGSPRRARWAISVGRAAEQIGEERAGGAGSPAPAPAVGQVDPVDHDTLVRSAG